MFGEAITYFNKKIAAKKYFNAVLCLCEKIERQGKQYPAVYIGNEYKAIDLDTKGSVCYWRKSGDVTISDEENNASSCSVQYKTTIALKLVGFIKKDNSLNGASFSDSICVGLISVLTLNNSALKAMLNAKKAVFIANGYSTDARKVVAEEYDNVDFEPRYSHAYFSINFDLIITTNSQCFVDICGDGLTTNDGESILTNDGEGIFID